MNKQLKVVFFGSRAFVTPVIKTIQENYDLKAIITVPDQPSGRSLKLTSTPVKEAFQNTNIPILSPDKYTPGVVEQLKSYNADLFIVAAYGKIIPNEILEIPQSGVINLHPSLLPKYRGASPIQNTLLNGDKITGMTYMLLDEKMDHGPIISQSRLDILESDNMETLGNRLFELASTEIIQIIDDFISGKLKPVAQNHNQATFCKLIKKEDGYFEIDNPPTSQIFNRMVRAYYPWPNVWTRWNGKVVKFYPNQIIQMEGKKPSYITDFLNGYPNFPLKELFEVD